MLTEIAQTRYVVIVNGMPKCAPQPTKQLAELELLKLSESERLLAEVQVVDSQGRNLLLG